MAVRLHRNMSSRIYGDSVKEAEEDCNRARAAYYAAFRTKSNLAVAGNSSSAIQGASEKASKIGNLDDATGTPVAKPAKSLQLCIRATDHKIHSKQWDAGEWLPDMAVWESTLMSSDPVAVQVGDSETYVFAVGYYDQQVWYRHWKGKSWMDYQSLGGYKYGPPAVASWGRDRIDIVGVTHGYVLHHRFWNGSVWSEWANLGGYCNGQPVLIAPAPCRLELFFTGHDGAIYHKSWMKGGWLPTGTAFENLGSAFSTPPAVVSSAPDRLDLILVGHDQALYHKWREGKTWYPSQSGFHKVGGSFQSRPAAVCSEPGCFNIFALGQDKCLYHKSWSNDRWGLTTQLGGQFTHHPTVVASRSGRLDVFLVGTDSAVYHKWWVGGVWEPGSDTFECIGGASYGAVAAVVG